MYIDIEEVLWRKIEKQPTRWNEISVNFRGKVGLKLDLILYNLVPQVLTEKHISSNIISKDKNNSCITKDRKV